MQEGSGIPVAVGTALANPHQPVWAVVGMRSLLRMGHELSVLSRTRTPVAVFVVVTPDDKVRLSAPWMLKALARLMCLHEMRSMFGAALTCGLSLAPLRIVGA